MYFSTKTSAALRATGRDRWVAHVDGFPSIRPVLQLKGSITLDVHMTCTKLFSVWPVVKAS